MNSGIKYRLPDFLPSVAACWFPSGNRFPDMKTGQLRISAGGKINVVATFINANIQVQAVAVNKS